MSKKIVAYNSIGDQIADELGWEIFDLCLHHTLRCAKWFIIVSSPVFVLGTIFAPHGVNRFDHGKTMVAAQHAFLWHYGMKGVAGTLEGVGNVLGPIIDNRSEVDQ